MLDKMTMAPEVLRSEDDHLDFCTEVFREIAGEDSQTLGPGKYAEIRFTDSHSRWVEARVLYQGNGEVFLQENMGDPLALLELRKKFQGKGVPVTGLGIDYQTNASPEVRQALGLEIS